MILSAICSPDNARRDVLHRLFVKLISNSRARLRHNSISMCKQQTNQVIPNVLSVQSNKHMQELVVYAFIGSR